MHYLEYRKLIQLVGNNTEIRGFLQGLITNNIEKLQPNSSAPLYALLLTPQGKIIADLFIFQIDKEIYLDVPAKLHSSIEQKLQMYKIGRRIEIFGNVKQYVHIKKSASIEVMEPRVEGFERFLANETSTNTDLYELYRVALIKACVPEFDGNIISEKYYPVDFEMENIAGSIDYKKGCYVGQEVTARTKYRGVKRKFLKIVRVEELEYETGALINQFAQSALVLVRK